MRRLEKNHWIRLALLVCAALGLSLGALVGSSIALGDEPSKAVFPTQKLPIKFSHKVHFEKGGKLDCDFCHETAPTSLTASDNLMPVEDACASCHKIDRDNPEKESKPASRCDSCHLYEKKPTGATQAAADSDSPKGPGDGSEATSPWMAPLRVDVPTPNIKFNHKVHAERDIKCEKCHGTLRDKDLATRDDLPKMNLCLTCHNNIVTSHKAESKSTRSPARCATCHVNQADGTMQTQFSSGRLVPSGTLKGDNHTLDFATHHSQVGRDESQYCENCHRKDFCLACHNGVVKPMSFHGNDYLAIHPIEARKATLNCEGCHRRQTFCLGCHERSGVTDQITADSPNNLHKASPARRFHPPYDKWVSAPRTPDHHSWQAERNLRACVACHREESCIQCHATSGVKTAGLPSVQPFHVNPHPAGFAGSRQCDTLSARNGRVCLKCHATDDPHIACR